MIRPLAYEPRHALNAVCPYFTMFPLEYPMRVLAKHRKESRVVVMDPFCGRGTSLYAARALGMASRGIDSSPIAVAIARAKLCEVDTESVLSLAGRYIDTVDPGAVPTSDFFELAFDREVLKQLCAVRQGLLAEREETDATVLLRAAMLGCLHGPRAKRIENQAYFSNQMPRTFSSKPDYSVGYWRVRGLTPPAIDLLSVLNRKLARLTAPSASRLTTFADVSFGDSRLASCLPPAQRDFSVVVTSPPYYGMRSYVEDQWLRNWFLGGPESLVYGQTTQVSHAGHAAFAESLALVWKNMARTKAERLDMYVRFGTIPSIRANAREIFLASLEGSKTRWKVKHTAAARTADSGKRQATQMATSSTASAEFDFHVVRI